MLQNISVNEALQILMGKVNQLEVIELTLLESVGSILATDLITQLPIPAFDRSPLDGFVVRAEDLTGATVQSPVTLPVAEFLPAGTDKVVELRSGQAMRIMTGAKIPQGGDVVIPFEKTTFTQETVQITNYYPPQTNIIKKSEEAEAGTTLLSKGTLLNAPEIGLIAALGHSRVQVYRKPVVGILATGDELESSRELRDGKVRDSNSFLLAAELIKMGITPVLLGICGDEREQIREKIITNIQSVDLFLTTGGVSVGDRDLVKEVFRDLNGEMLFWKVRMKPGTPVTATFCQSKLLIGLSGNPSASYLSFLKLVRPVLFKMMGRLDYQPQMVSSILENSFTKTSAQDRIVHGYTYYRDGMYYTRWVEKQSPGSVTALAGFNSLFVVPGGSEGYQAGEEIEVELLR